MIERGRTTDADVLADLWVDLATDQLAHGSHLLPAENRENIRESLLRHAVAGTLFVAGEGDAIVGFVTCSVETGGYEQDERRGMVENLYVVPERRDDGIGTALLERAEAALRERGCTVVALDVMATNEDARRFYERHGYDPHRVELEKEL
ncbi:GNAT family N-acetyltransferase [Salinirubellus salinus]|uniref:GNAT family N-acetyltransferase n=1 Tax=Salinirubellus salinus TaxID=1364945 RepID=A0A9E7UCA4_9EURY|nr:GNAT family N-acetyltransferase [Salinirubellus salinus]UWM56073.1 GNAT family N-acetyltransferase [Salinirubellus salinus]